MTSSNSSTNTMEGTIESKYNNYLDELSRLIGNTTTYDHELDRVCRKLFKEKWRGVYSLDKLPTKINKNNMLIFNLDKSNEPGSHWCALYNDGKHNWVYDSFARRVLGSGYKYSDLSDREQKIKEKNCGQRCIAWLLCVNKYGIDLSKLI